MPCAHVCPPCFCCCTGGASATSVRTLVQANPAGDGASVVPVTAGAEGAPVTDTPLTVSSTDNVASKVLSPFRPSDSDLVCPISPNMCTSGIPACGTSSGGQCNIGGCFYHIIYCSSVPGGGGGYYFPYLEWKRTHPPGMIGYYARLYAVRTHVVADANFCGAKAWSTCFFRAGRTETDGCDCLCAMLIHAAASQNYLGCRCINAITCQG